MRSITLFSRVRSAVLRSSGEERGQLDRRYVGRQQRYGPEVAARPQPAQQVFVRLDSGVLVSITQPTNPALQQGQKVLIEGSGSSARVVPKT